MTQSDNGPELISARILQRGLGILGFTLPIILYFGNLLIFGDGELKSSLSSYYNTEMRDVLVGSLFAFGVALMAYKGYERIDNVVGTFAGIFAIGTALFATPAPGVDDPQARIIHGIFSILFYGSLAVFSLWLFRKTREGMQRTPAKEKRDMVYLVSGIVIVISMIVIALTWLFDLQFLGGSATFWFETLANTAFGISWFVKGGLVPALNDE